MKKLVTTDNLIVTWSGSKNAVAVSGPVGKEDRKGIWEKGMPAACGQESDSLPV